VLEGIAFVLILACETLYGRITWRPGAASAAVAAHNSLATGEAT
jgi:hypothetical protein